MKIHYSFKFFLDSHSGFVEEQIHVNPDAIADFQPSAILGPLRERDQSTQSQLFERLSGTKFAKLVEEQHQQLVGD